MERMKNLISLFLGIFFFLPLLAWAEFPEREITVYCSSSAGGVTDLSIRFASDMASKQLGKPIVIVNKPGASHSIASNLVANAKPDGYTIGAISGSAFGEIPYIRKVSYDFRKDFAFIATYSEYPQGLAVKADAPWKTLDEFLNYAKKNPGKIIYSTDGHGVAAHILMEYLALKKGGIEWKHLPIAGGPGQVTALLGGHTNAYGAAGSHVPFVKDKTMRLLVTFNQTRMKYAPEVPTLLELGYPEVPKGVSIYIVSPKGVPAAIRDKLEGTYLKALREPGYRDLQEKLGMPPIAYVGSKETAADVELKAKIWGELIKRTGIKEQEEFKK